MANDQSTDKPQAKQHAGALLSLWLIVCRLAVGGLLGLAAFYKLQDPQSFAFAIKAYKILPRHLVHVSAFAIPWLEALVAIALVIGLWTRAAAMLASLLLASFLYALASVMIRDLHVDCSCFGDAVVLCPEQPGWCHIAQDSILLILSAMVVIWGPGRASADHMLASTPQPNAQD